jgi:hypothetical protein
VASGSPNVFDETLRLLVERLGLPQGELASMLRLLQSDLDLTRSRLLAPASCCRLGDHEDTGGGRVREG